MISQPVWKFVCNLGDVNPLEEDGLFVYEDETGVYPPEAEVLNAPMFRPSFKDRWRVWRFVLEPCTFVDGILSDSPGHPEHPAWFADELGLLGSFIGVSRDEFVKGLLGDVRQRAWVWFSIGQFFGFENLDSDPVWLNKEQVEARYPQFVR